MQLQQGGNHHNKKELVEKYNGKAGRKTTLGKQPCFTEGVYLPTTPAALSSNLENLINMEAIYFDI